MFFITVGQSQINLDYVEMCGALYKGDEADDERFWIQIQLENKRWRM